MGEIYFHSLFHNCTAFPTVKPIQKYMDLLSVHTVYPAAWLHDPSRNHASVGSEAILSWRATDSGISASMTMVESRTSECNTRPRAWTSAIARPFDSGSVKCK